MIDFKVVDGMVLPLGWQDTKNVATFVFDVSQFEGGGIFTIRVWRPGDAEGHLVAYGRDDDGNLTWTPDEFETAKAGQGQVQIFLMNGDTIVASRWWQTEVRRSVPLKGKLPKEAVKWYQQMVSLAQDAKDAGDRMDAIMSGGEADQVLTQTESGIPTWADQQGGGTSKIFIAEENVTTYEQISQAISAGKIVFAKENGSSLPNFVLSTPQSGGKYAFSQIRPGQSGGRVDYMHCSSSDTWSKEHRNFQQMVGVDGTNSKTLASRP